MDEEPRGLLRLRRDCCDEYETILTSEGEEFVRSAADAVLAAASKLEPPAEGKGEA